MGKTFETAELTHQTKASKHRKSRFIHLNRWVLDMKRLILFFGALWLIGGVYSQEPIDIGLLQLSNNEQLRRGDSPVQTFFVADFSGLERWRYVYWPESRYLIRLPNSANQDQIWDNMELVSRFINLEKDLVATREQIGSSTYLEIEEEILMHIRQCLSGKLVLLSRRDGKYQFLYGGGSKGPEP